jgi:hypothetical protein
MLRQSDDYGAKGVPSGIKKCQKKCHMDCVVNVEKHLITEVLYGDTKKSA